MPQVYLKDAIRLFIDGMITEFYEARGCWESAEWLMESGLEYDSTGRLSGSPGCVGVQRYQCTVYARIWRTLCYVANQTSSKNELGRSLHNKTETFWTRK